MKTTEYNPEGSVRIRFADEEAVLLPEKAVLFPGTSELLLSDIHLGKSSHFRRSGIAVPSSLYSADLLKLGNLIRAVCPARVIILGDLFHIGHEKDAELFSGWRDSFSTTAFTLVRGNHDRIPDHEFNALGLEAVEEYRLRGFHLVHIPGDAVEDSLISIHGHVHPAVRVFGKARQSAVLQCFHLRKKTLTLPAFGEFTGNHIIRPERGDGIFAIVNDGIHPRVVPM